MRQLTLLQLLLVSIIAITDTYAKAHKKAKFKNPDILKEFRSFADSVIPEVSHQIAILVPTGGGEGIEHSVEKKNTPFTRQIKNPQEVVYVDEPSRQVTRKVAFTNNVENGLSAIDKSVGNPRGSPVQRDDTHTHQSNINTQAAGAVKTKSHKGSKAGTKNTNVIPEANTNTNGTNTANENTEKPSEGLHNYKDDDEVDTYIDEKEEKSVKAKSTARKKEEEKKKKRPSQKLSAGRKDHLLKQEKQEPKGEPRPLKPIKQEKQEPKEEPHQLRLLNQEKQESKVKNGSANSVLKEHRNALKPLKHQMGGAVTNVKSVNHPTTAAATNPNNKNKMNKNNSNVQQQPQKVATQKETKPAARLLPESQQCIASCPASCSPACTPQCCTMDTAPPPVKKARGPIDKDKEIRWYERPRYEPGPNYPPPPIPARIVPGSGCDASCARTCTPKCPSQCCRPKQRAFLPVVGCSKECTPSICLVGCPAHCCARYVRKSSVNPVITNLSI